jgi:hypothetical protein
MGSLFSSMATVNTDAGATTVNNNGGVHILGTSGSVATMIWIAIIVIVLAGAGILAYIWRDDKREKKKADLEAGGTRQRRMDVIRAKLEKYTTKAQESTSPEKRAQKENLIASLREELEGLELEDYRENRCREVVPYRPMEQHRHHYQLGHASTTTQRGARRDMLFGDGPLSSAYTQSASRDSSEALECSIALMAQTVGRSARRTEQALSMMSSSLSAQQRTTEEIHKSLRRYMRQTTGGTPKINLDSDDESIPNLPPHHSTPVSPSSPSRRFDMKRLIAEQSALLDVAGSSNYRTPPTSRSMCRESQEVTDHADSEEVRRWLSLSARGSPTLSRR